MCSFIKQWKPMMVYICAVILSLSGFAAAEPLHEAAKKGDLAEVKSLIAEGSGVNVKTGTGTTPLHFAADQGHKDVAELLILKGADVNATNSNNETPLGYAYYNNHKDVVELLIKHGGNY